MSELPTGEIPPRTAKRKYTRKAQGDGTIQIEKGIPIPPSRTNKYPWAMLEPGDSFFVPNGPPSLAGTCSKKNKEGAEGWTARSATHRGVKGVRVWRTK